MKTGSSRARGFSLIEALIAVALLGLAAAAFMELTDNINSGFKRELVNGQSFIITDRIRAVLDYETTCRLSFGGPNLYGGFVNPSTNQVMSQVGSTPIVLYSPTALSGRSVFLNPADPSHNSIGSWTITALTLDLANPSIPVACNSTVPSKLTYTGQSTIGTRKLISNIYLSVKLDAACNIVSCYPITYASDGNPIPLCKGNEVATAAGPHVGCRLATCPLGTTANGWDTIGNVICVGCIPNDATCVVGGVGAGACCSGNCFAPPTGYPYCQ